MFDELNLDEDKYKIIPISMGCTRHHTFTFEGWNGITFIYDDTNLNDVIELARKTLMNFIDMYKDKYAFSQPLFSFTLNPLSVFSLKIGMLELEIYEERKNKEENAT